MSGPRTADVREVELTDLASRLVALAGDGEEIEVVVRRSRETDVEVFGGEVESLTVAQSAHVGVRVLRGGRQGCAWAGTLDDPESVVAEARDNAPFGAPDEWYGFAGPEDVAGPVADLQLVDDGLATVGTDTKVQLALDAEAATRSADPRIRGVESAGYGDAVTEAAVVNSRGVVAHTRRTMCSLHAVAMAADGDETRTGYGFTAGRGVDDLDRDAVPRDAVERSVRLLGARQPAGRRLPVVLDPLVTRAFLGVLAAAFGGEAVLKGRSLFGDRLGEAVGAPAVTIVDDPTDGRALMAAPYDAEGVPTRRTELVVDGVLGRFLHNVYTGRRSGTGTTGSAVGGGGAPPGVGVRALRLEPGARTADEILAAAGDALYVQSVSGLHSGTNPVSGAFSVGVEGLMVRDGALAEPVREATIASTLPRMLLDIAEVGADLVFLPGTTAGQTVLVSEMTLSGS